MIEMYKIADTTINLISSEESFSAFPYKDDYKPSPQIEFSIGYGHQIQPGEYFDTPMSKTTGKTLLKQDLTSRINAVNQVLKPGLKQHQIDSILDLTMSMGPGAIKSNSLIKLINSGASDDVIRNHWENHYIISGGGESEVLKQRRKREVNLFLSEGYESFFLIVLKIIFTMLVIYLLYLLFIKK